MIIFYFFFNFFFLGVAWREIPESENLLSLSVGFMRPSPLYQLYTLKVSQEVGFSRSFSPLGPVLCQVPNGNFINSGKPVL